MNENDMKRMQQEAMRRAKEMQSCATELLYSPNSLS